MRRDMDRMAVYIDGLPRSGTAVRQPFELGRAAMAAYEWEQAIEHFREAMARARGAEIVALFNLTGVCQYTQGQLEKALADFEESFRLAKQFRDVNGEAPALGNIGVILHDTPADYFPAYMNAAKASLEKNAAENATTNRPLKSGIRVNFFIMPASFIFFILS